MAAEESDDSDFEVGKFQNTKVFMIVMMISFCHHGVNGVFCDDDDVFLGEMKNYFNLDNDNCSYDDDFDHSSNHDGDNQKDDNKDGDYNDNNILKNRVKIKRKSYH